MKKNLLKTLAAPSALILSVSMAALVLADDTELYSATYQAGATGKPKVLVLFDDSGSMNEVVEGIKPDYDPNATYVQKVQPNRIYWSTSGTPPNVNGSSGRDNWFPASANGCADSWSALETVGRYSGTPLYWQEADGEMERVCTRRNRFGTCTRWEDRWEGDAAGWLELDNDVNDPYTVDCRQDVLAKNPDNASGISDGYPREPNDPNTPNSNAYTAQSTSSNVDWEGGRVFYTSHYIDWYYDDSIVPEDKDYLQIAQEVIESIVRSNPTVDFGLGVFNHNVANTNDNGGRIVQRIIPNMTEDDRDDLIDVLWGFDHAGNTPLCETAYEAFRYMTGQQALYGKSGNSGDLPLRDLLAESGGTASTLGTYIAPIEACTNTYMIIMTDGLPTQDTAANSAIRTLTGRSTCPTYSSIDPVYGDTVSFSNCMAPLTEYMAEEDLFGDLGDGTQSVLTATIGFNVDPRADAFLTDAATMLKPADNSPAYYSTESADELTASFTEIILGILSTETTFTSPAVAVDTFTRTQSRDDVFFAMFEPGATADWWGNIKKLKLVISNQGEAEIKDADGQLAFNNSGLIKDTARSYWSTGPDGPQVPSGGVGAVLQARTLSTRDILTNTGANGALQALNTTNVNAAAYGMGDADEVYAFWLADDEDDFADTIRWGWGYDVDDIDEDNDRNETRRWIMADILHSKPLVINYGALGSFTEANPDMRIVVGTNNGLLHMFNNADGSEDWAFFPKELGAVLTQRRKNIRSGKNVYGVDAPPVVYTIDTDQDGTLDYRDGDKVYLYFGLRRGGREYYALDISNPDQPQFMWSISPDTTGFSELGQTWSVPTIAKIPGYRDNGGLSKPVLIFGGGYDEVNDSHATFADTEADTMGRGVYIVDAVTGALVWSVTPAANSATNMQAAALTHAISADVTTVDSNGDELIDRIYAADVGGNVWRIDLPGNALPTSSQATWFLTHLLDANKNTQTTDRRFFNAPDVVRTTFNGAPVDAVMIGSGDRTNPIAKDNPTDVNDRTVDDQFYMIRDQRTVPYVAALDSDDCDKDPVADFRCFLPLDPAATDPVDLYDITENLLQFGSDEEKLAAEAALAEAHGWKLDLTADGEKALSRALTIAGKLFFTTFSPVADVVGCGFSAGAGRLYALDMLTGKAIHDFDGDGEDANDDGQIDDENDYERSWIIGGLIPHTPSTYFGPDGQIWLLLPPGDSGEAKATGNPFKTGATLPGPYGSYWDRGDYP